jgi:hypothetical protein
MGNRPTLIMGGYTGMAHVAALVAPMLAAELVRSIFLGHLWPCCGGFLRVRVGLLSSQVSFAHSVYELLTVS